MMYDIQLKNDVASGAVLTIRFPEEDVDKKALYTIQSAQPEFLVPFFMRSVDGFAECTYQLGMRSELRHRFGRLPAKEYVKLWTLILQPLLDCEDWFLKPSSFVLDTNYLYVDKTGSVVSYIYIPSKTNCVEDDALKKMVSELSSKNSTNDEGLENQVWRALAQGFNPRNFLQMLTDASPAPGFSHTGVREVAPAPPPRPVSESAPAPLPNPAPGSGHRPAPGPRDIIIQTSTSDSNDKQRNKEAERLRKEEERRRKEEEKRKKKEEKKNRPGFFRRNVSGSSPQEVAAVPYIPQAEESKPAPLPQAPVPPYNSIPDDDGETQIIVAGVAGAPYLRLVGDNSLPSTVPVPIQPGQSFTIGRFDVSVGQKQSDFEFEKRTKAVSRHHAVIERLATGEYQLKDLASSAGTFINGTRLTPNVNYPINRNDKISFGTCGADYIWEA